MIGAAKYIQTRSDLLNNLRFKIRLVTRSSTVSYFKYLHDAHVSLKSGTLSNFRKV